MRSTTAFIVSIATCVAAVNDNVWKAPTASDRRSPCPMMNSLANSGYINRDGLNISKSSIETALLDVINMDPAVSGLVTAVAVKTSTTGYADTINLDDLTKHGIIEHDASLSRGDWLGGKGDSHSFNAEIWANTASHFTSDKISIEDMARARAAAVARANSTNPNFEFGAAQLQGSTLECTLLLGTFGDMTNGNANVKYVRTLVENERLPFEEGWTKPTERIVLAGIQSLSKKLLTAAI
ncbi:hypothetical protein PG990_009427 [Apiospora arundinis]|uniref:Heme haloperoxidase family profile domain-containing protein n=1 Tax=Apiospora arundinis TaxID=335852 RepID=A0ABR2ISN7_9PEZI